MFGCDDRFGSDLPRRKDSLLHIWWTWWTRMVLSIVTYNLEVDATRNEENA